MPWKKRKISPFARNCLQSSQPVSLSWLYGLLLPNCVFINSSPARNIGVPFDKNSRQQKFLICFRRSASTSGEALSSPSLPQFQLWLSSVPSWLLFPFFQLCLRS